MRRILLISLIILVPTSCNKAGTGMVTDGPFEALVTATLPECPVVDVPSTRASTQYTVRIKWTEGDRLSVINLTTGKILGGQMTANSAGTSTTFSGQLTGTVREGDTIAYFYPAQSNASEVDFTEIQVDMSSQRGTTGAVPLCVFSIVQANSQSFTNAAVSFSFLMSYIMIGLSDIPASTTIRSVTLTQVTDAFEVKPNSAKTGFDLVPHTGDIVLTPGQNASATGVKTVYAAVPGSASTERSVILETSTTTFTTAFTSARLQDGYAYNTNVSGFLVDDLIPEDPLIREYCLAHFDANGDGKLSMVEIAGVTSFPEPLPAGIRRFNELEYFYGLTSLPSFKAQRQLECITIPKQITSIPDEMFLGCSTLVKIRLKPLDPPVLGQDVFSGLSTNVILVVADEAVAAYQTADGWKDFFNNFRTESSQNDSNVDIDTEDEDTMGTDRIDIVVNG